jgi:uncharacterized membrane protein
MGEIEEWLRRGAEGVALAAEVLGALVVAVALISALLSYARDLLGRAAPFPQERVRLGVGRALALALEFLLAADIVRTAVAPTWEDIGKLAAVAAIRTALNFFLQREINQEERRLTADRAGRGDG